MVAYATRHRAKDEIEKPLVVDLEVSQIRVRAFCADVDDPSPVIDCFTTHLTSRVSVTSYAGHRSIDLAVWVRKIELLLCTPKPVLKLQDVESAGVPGLAVCRITCEGLEAKLDTRSRHQVITVRLNTFNTGIVTPAFESIRDVVQIWQAACACLLSPADTVKPVAFVIHDAVRSAIAAGQTGTQPQFANVTMYALQAEDPRNVRKDFGWTLLARLRYWRNTLPTSPDICATDDIASCTIEHLAAIETKGKELDNNGLEVSGQTEDENLDEIEERRQNSLKYIRELAFMKIAFGYDIPSDTPDQKTLLGHTTHIFANIDLFHLEHQGKMLESDQIVSSSLNVVSASTGLQYLTAYKKSRLLKRMRIINTVKAFDLVLQNSIFNAIEPLLSLIPVSDEVNQIDKVDCDEQNILVMDNQIERAELQMVAAGLRMKGVLDRGSFNINHETGKGLEEGPDSISSRTKATMMVSSMETVLSVVKERIHSASSMPIGIVATWETKDLGGMASHIAFEEQGFPDELKVLLSLRRFDLDISPQMKALQGLINHVRREDLP